MAKTMALTGAYFTLVFLVEGALAIIEPSINPPVFYFHEKIWQRVGARRRGLSWGAGAPF